MSDSRVAVLRPDDNVPIKRNELEELRRALRMVQSHLSAVAPPMFLGGPTLHEVVGAAIGWADGKLGE